MKTGFRDTEQKASRPRGAPPPSGRGCDHPGCVNDGDYRAPRVRDRLNDYYWFCLNHVRDYNANWDYYAGMSAQDIEKEVRHDTTWQRPTWPMGSGGTRRGPYINDVHDPYDVFGDAGLHSQPGNSAKPRPRQEVAAMSLLGVTDPLTVPDLKARYKELVKLHHPDANGGDRLAEERFKETNGAYRLLLASFETPARV
jgi:hypothetical protein